MRLSTKIWLIAALSLILLAGVVFASVMTALDWDFTRLYTIKYETNEYEITDDFSGFVINTDVADIDFVPSENGKYSVECYEQENMPHEISVKNGMLTVRVIDTRKWYEYISINFESPKITVCVPAGEYGALSVKSSTGDVTLPKEFSFESIERHVN